MDDSFDSESYSRYRETLQRSRQEAQAFHRQLKDFPNSFQLQDLDRLDQNYYSKLLGSLQSALSVGYPTPLETARARNMLAFVLHKLGRSQDALNELETVLKLDEQSSNLVTLANKAIILYEGHHLTKADEQVDRLKQIRENSPSKDFDYLVTKATAELAFAYTRLGPSYGRYAIDIFQEGIAKVEDRNPVKWLWTFGMILTKRRQLRILPTCGVPPEGESLNCYREVLCAYLDLHEHVADKTFRAKIYAELALLLDSVRKSDSARSEFSEKSGLTPIKACDIALELDGNDNSVLCKCGRIYRYNRQPEKSKELLEKALSLRPSSTGYHHLGNTYKVLATDNKRKEQPRPMSRTSRRRDYQDLVQSHGIGSAQAASSIPDDPPVPRPLSPTKEVRSVQLIVKSPPKGVTPFTKQDKYVAEAIANLKRAVEFGEGLNHRAALDLAIMQRNIGELEAARDSLVKLLGTRPPDCASDHITIYDQLGSVMRELADQEKDVKMREELKSDSNRWHLKALRLASQLLGKVPGVREHIGEIWDAFQSLLHDAEYSADSNFDKLLKKADLFQLVKSHNQSINILKEIKSMDPERVNDPHYIKVTIENYVEMNKFEEALTLLELFGWSTQHYRMMELFGDSLYLPKVYIQAAHQSLLQGSPKAKDYFQAVFQETVVVYNDATSGSEDTSDAASEVSSKAGSASDERSWDLIIIHEDEASSQEKAETLASLLTDACGLRVPVLARDQPTNRLELEGVLRMMRRSAMVVVLAGSRRVSKELRYLIHNVLTRPSTVTLLAEGQHVPEMLRKAHRSMTCPEKLLTVKAHSAVQARAAPTPCYADPLVADAICSLFRFLISIPAH